MNVEAVLSFNKQLFEEQVLSKLCPNASVEKVKEASSKIETISEDCFPMLRAAGKEIETLSSEIVEWRNQRYLYDYELKALGEKMNKLYKMMVQLRAKGS